MKKNIYKIYYKNIFGNAVFTLIKAYSKEKALQEFHKGYRMGEGAVKVCEL